MTAWELTWRLFLYCLRGGWRHQVLVYPEADVENATHICDALDEYELAVRQLDPMTTRDPYLSLVTAVRGNG